MSETGQGVTFVAPTAKQLKKGPVVKLTRPGWAFYTWSPHGLAYNIRFNDGKATMLASHFDAWIGDDFAATNGITVTRPKKKPAAKKD